MSADRTGEPSDQPHRARVMAVVFPLLLAAHLVVAGVCRFNLRTSEDVEIALQWGIPVGCALWAYLVVATYRKTGWGDRNQGFGRIFLTSIGTAVASALVICSLHWTVPCEGYEVARYYRALALSASVFVFANAAIVFVLIALLYVLCARLWTSILIGMSITVMLHVIHMVKYIVLQQHLYTWDYMLLGDMFEVLPMMLSTAGAIGAIAGGGVIVVAIGAVAWKESPVDSLRRRAGLLLGGLSTVGVVLLLTTIGATGRGNEPREFFPMWNRLSYNSHYNKSGFYFALLRGTRYLENSRSPEGYSPEAMERIARQYPRTKGEIVPTADVILYMVESLADLSEYGLTYRTDPIPNFHAIARRHAGGRLIVPIYGGNTPNTEFEVLTGLSRVHPWPHDLSYAYRQWITGKTPALPWVFRRWGYRTAVVSGATADFFAEKEAYPRLGFHEFRALGDRAGVATKFDLVSDEAVVDEVISILRSAGREAEAGTTRRRPCFLSITTDSSHGPYRSGRVPADPRFELTDTDVPEAVRDYAVHYGTVLHHADSALGRLVAFLEARAEPTILLVYGDHKPAMPELFSAGVFRSDWPGGVIDKYSTPLAIWSNLPHAGAAEAPQVATRSEGLFLSANFLSAELFSRLGVRHPPSTFHLTQEVYKTFPVLSRIIADREGRFHRREDLRDRQADVFRDYGLTKYHVLVGSRGK